MAKSNSPVRLESGLMKQAKLSGALNKRSAAEQIEYWANIGRGIANLVDPETLIKLKSGIAKINIEQTDDQRIDPDDIFKSLDTQRESGLLSETITSAKPVFQASQQHAGMLEKVDAQGNVSVGHFVDGAFVEHSGTA